MTVQSSSNLTKAATGVAGSALVGNAIFGGKDKSDVAGAIVVFYIIFGGFVGFFKYIANVLRWLGYEDVKGSSKAAHILLPWLSLIGGVVGWKVSLFCGVTNGLIAMAVALVAQFGLASWCFHKLAKINVEEQKEDQVGYGTAAYLYIGSIFLAATIYSFVVMFSDAYGDKEVHPKPTVSQVEQPKVVQPAQQKVEGQEIKMVAAQPTDKKPEQSVKASPLFLKEEIAAKDKEINEAWKQLRNVVPQTEWQPIRDQQREWVKSKEQCPSDECLLEKYVTRIAEINRLMVVYGNVDGQEMRKLEDIR